MALTAPEIEARSSRLGGSDCPCLMTGDEAKIFNLWCEKVGDPRYVPVDLSGVWPVQLGSATEALNLQWYARKTGHAVTRMGEVVTHAEFDWAAATLDGWDESIPAPIECKHVGGREPLAVVIERYQPQMHWQMLITGARSCMLSVIEGCNEPVRERIEFSEEYGKELWTRAAAFWLCVETLTPPVACAPVAAPVVPVKIYDMSTSNSWAQYAADWLANIVGKRAAEKAEKEIKALVPADAARAHGHGVIVSRDRANRLSLREHKSHE